MFGFSWAEIGLIMAVALIAIGPKDLPVAIRTVTAMIRKARAMAAEFQGHVDEMMREANLSEVRSEIDKIRRFDFKTAVEKEIDPDGSLKSAFPASPFQAQTEPRAEIVPVTAEPDPQPEGPAFIPPDEARKAPVPAFIPPGTRRWGY